MQVHSDSDPKIIASVRFSLILLAFIALGIYSQVNAQTITGNVFRDFNANGVKDNTTTFNEIGVGGITVKCTDSGGSLATTTTSTTAATLGDYSLSGCTAATRVEFTWAQTSDYSGVTGTGSNTSVQFINATRTGVNFGINYPGDYWDNVNMPAPPMLIPFYSNGTYTGPNSTTKSLLQIAYDQNSMTPVVNTVATLGEVGATWGVAADKELDRAFFSSFLKRHVGFGPQGPGGIYIAENIGGLYDLMGSFTLQGVTPSNGGAALDFGSVTRVTTPTTADNYIANGASKTEPSRDLDAFTNIGKVSYGDIDVDESTHTLYAISLFQRNLIAVDISSPTSTLNNASVAILSPLTRAWNMTTLTGWPTCTGGIAIPWALKIYKGKAYVGVVCNGETSQIDSDVKLYVLSLNLSNIAGGFTQELIYNNYDDYNAWANTWANTGLPTSGVGFTSYEYRQPIVADIEFDESGDMTIGLMNRFGMQMGLFNYIPVSGNTTVIQAKGYGDITKVCNNAGVFSLGATACPTPATGLTSEFYAGDHAGDGTPESSNGGLAKLMGTDDMVNVVSDPYPVGASSGSTYFVSGGLHWYSDVNGTKTQAARLFIAATNEAVNTFGKAIGLGDVELLTTPAPLEIGNRVWLDTDKDGIQDPDEAGIDGVVVTLMIGSEMVTTTTATVNGQAGVYYFKDGTGLPPAWGGIIPRNAIAKLFVADTYTSGATTYKATIANVGTDDTIDADGINMASQGTTAASVRIDFNTGFAGQNNHTYDFGYNVDTLMNFLNCAEVSAQDQTDLDSTPSDGTGDEYACATTTKTTSVTYDWGDNPDTGAGSGAGNYLTSTGDNGPRHQIVTGLKLGATVDAETDGQGTGTTSTGDDTNGVPDDEDGVTLPTFTEGVATPLNFTLMNMTGAVAKLCGWIDFNKDGVYDNTTERQCTNVADLATTATLTFTAPAGTAGTTYARFRLSTDAAFITAMDPTGVATSGEVEDYQATITAAPIFDLALDKKLSTGQATTVNAGDLVSFDITVYNQGSVDATGISITDYVDLTKFDAFAVADNPTGNSTVTVLPYTWNAAGVATLTGTLPMGASLKIPVKLRIKAGATGIAVNKAEISAALGGTDIDSTPDGTDGNQTGEVLPVMVDDQVTGNGTTGGDEDDHDLAQVTINVPLTADLELIKIADKTQVRVGDLLTYTLQITNKGPGTATAVKVKDTLPIGVSLQGTPVASVGTFDSATGIWTVGDMLNGTSATLTITVIVQ